MTSTNPRGENPASYWTHYAVRAEDDFFINHKSEYCASENDVQKLRLYWLSKPWLTDPVKDRLKRFFENANVFLTSLPNNKTVLSSDGLRHHILKVLVYYFWYEDKFEPAFKVLRKSSKEWKTTLKRLSLALDELRRNVVPLFDLTGLYYNEGYKAMYMTRPAELVGEWAYHLQEVKDHIKRYQIDNENGRQGLLKLYGFSAKGNVFKLKENCGLVKLKSLFERFTGKPNYRWIGMVLNYASENQDSTPCDEKSIIRRIKRFQSLSQKGRLADFLFENGGRPPATQSVSNPSRF